MNLKKLIREIPNFPQDGVSYKDITPLLKDPAGLSAAVQIMLEPFADAEVDVVVGIEARGFVFATPIALELGCGFVPVRKPGKLPAATLSRELRTRIRRDLSRNPHRCHRIGAKGVSRG